MFDELDDGPDFVPSPDFRAGVDRRARDLRRRSRFVRSVGIVLALGVVAAGGLALAVQRRDQAIDRIDVVTNPSVDGAVNVLVLGTDLGGRGDTAIVVRFAPDGSFGVLTIPRDLFVVGPDGTGGDRIDASLAAGPDGYIAALDRSTGLPVDHVVQLDFDGFRDLVDAVGGLRVSVLAELKDVHVGLHLRPSGCTTLDGEEALQLARARYVQVRRHGLDFAPDPTADLGRSGRAQVLASAVLQQLIALDPDPGDLDRLSRVLADHATLDEGLDLWTIASLGRRLIATEGNGLTASLPVTAYTGPGGAALLTRVGGDDLLRQFGAIDPPPPAVADGDPDVIHALPAVEQLAPCATSDLAEPDAP